MADSQLTLALVGCGLIARAHIDGIRRFAPRIKVTACIDTDFERAKSFADSLDAVAYDSLETAIRVGTFDAVDIMLPHDQHSAAAKLCFTAGKAVVLEKPIAPTLDVAEDILASARKAGIKLMVAEQAQYWPDIQKTRELVDAGAIGEVITGKAVFYDPSRWKPGDPIPWRFSNAQAGGGISIDGGAHWIRPMRMMLGEIDSVIAATSRHIPEMEGETLAHAILKFDSGVIGTFQCLQTVATFGPGADFRITGTQGEIVIERGGGGKLMLYRNGNRDGEAIMSSSEGKAASYGVELDDFSHFVLDGRPLAAGPEVALGELRTALAMYRSVASGTWEKVWD